MIDVSALRMLLAVLTGWLDRQEREAIAYLIEENRILSGSSDATRSMAGLAR